MVPEYGKVESGDRVGSDDSPCDSPDPLAPPQLFQRGVKRAFDIVVAIIGLILFSPIFLFSSLAIKLDSRGPIACRQVRYGYGNETFRAFTFRCTGAKNPENADQAAQRGACVTGVGRILRSSGIDGLPLLINVLRGEMSIVGPHPYETPPGVIFDEQLSRLSRHRNAKPGLTGWARVHGYSDLSNSLTVMRRRIAYDLYYVENWSFLFDLKIILMMLFSKNAYAITEQRDDGRPK